MIVGKRQIAAGFKQNEIYSELLRAIKLLKQDGWDIDVVAHNRGDVDFYKFLQEKNINLKLIELFGDCVKQDLYCGIKYYSDIPYVFGIRGHAGMISFGMGGIPFTLEIHNKLRYFQEDIGLPENCMNPNESSWGYILYNKIRDTYNKYHFVRSDLDKTRTNLFKTTINNLDCIYSQLGKKTTLWQSLK